MKAHEFWLRARFVQTESKALSKSLFCRIFYAQPVPTFGFAELRFGMCQSRARYGSRSGLNKRLRQRLKLIRHRSPAFVEAHLFVLFANID